MFRTRALWRILLLAVLIGGPVALITLHGQQPQKPAEDEFRPISELPPGEQLPAAPLLITAYSVVWLLVAGYLFSIWKRLDRVDREIAEVSRRISQRRSSDAT